jgi:hypothetical protein
MAARQAASGDIPTYEIPRSTGAPVSICGKHPDEIAIFIDTSNAPRTNRARIADLAGIRVCSPQDVGCEIDSALWIVNLAFFRAFAGGAASDSGRTPKPRVVKPAMKNHRSFQSAVN